MNRSTLDRLISSVGLTIAVVLLAGGGLLLFANNFIHQQVADQLSVQRIEMPSGAAIETLTSSRTWSPTPASR